MLIPVVLALYGPLLRHADVLRLLVGQLGERSAELPELQARHLLVQLLGQDVDADRVASVLVQSSIWASTWLAKEELMT